MSGTQEHPGDVPRPSPAPADAGLASAADVRQLTLDQVMGRVRQEVERRSRAQASPSSEPSAGPANSGVKCNSASGEASGATASPGPPNGGRTATGREGPVLSTEEIMRRVRLEVKQRRGEVAAPEADAAQPDGAVPNNTTAAASGPTRLPLRAAAIAPLPLKPEYALHALLQFSDADFVDTVYRVILRRPADAEGRARYLSALRNGLASKTEVLGFIRFSQEGRQRGVHIDGLLLRFKLQRWRHLPVLGRCLAFAMAVARLPRLSMRLQAIEGHAARDNQALTHYIDVNNTAISSCLDHLDGAIMSLRAQVARVDDVLHATAGRIDAVEQNLALQRQQTDALLDEHNRAQHELAERLNNQRSTIEVLREDLQGQQRQQREKEQGQAARLVAQEAALEQLRVQLGAVRDELSEGLRALAGNRAAREAATARLDSELAAARRRYDAELDALKKGLSGQQSAMSALDQQLMRSRTANDDRIKNLMGRLDDQMLAISDLAGDVGALQETGEKGRQHLAAQLAGAQAEMGTVHDQLGAALTVADTQAHMQRALEEGRDAQAALEQRLVEQAARIHAFDDAVRAQKDAAEHQHHEVVSHLSAHDTMLKNLTVEGQRVHHGALEIQRQLIALLDRNMSPTPDASGEPSATGAGDKVLSPQYVAFEDAFRGEREDIKQRVAPYVDTLAAAGIGPDRGLVLDLGCGRGEWLEVLGEAGYKCRGIDLNSAMVADCAAGGFDAVEADALGYLREQADASIAAVTAMHIVEHIPHNTLIRLLDEAWRVLIPGGVLILETPNPENLTVGSCLFYLDPTHRNPIPPALLQWTVKERGFDEAAVERLTAHRGNPALAHVADDVPAAAQINQMIDWFTAAPDYAIVAKKPADEIIDGGEPTTDA